MSMTVIQHIELTSSQASITFSSIPQTYTDLYLVVSLRTDHSIRTPTQIKPNNSTANLTNRRLIGYDNNQVFSGTESNIFVYSNGTGETANTFTNGAVYIPNYTSSVAKSFSLDVVQENNSSAVYVLQILAGLWNDTSAITSLVIDPDSGSLVSGSSATLYGILKGSLPGVTVS